MEEDVKRELRKRARKDFHTTDLSESEWIAFWKGYLLSLRRFGGHGNVRSDRRQIKSKMGYSRVGRNNV